MNQPLKKREPPVIPVAAASLKLIFPTYLTMTGLPSRVLVIHFSSLALSYCFSYRGGRLSLSRSTLRGRKHRRSVHARIDLSRMGTWHFLGDSTSRHEPALLSTLPLSLDRRGKSESYPIFQANRPRLVRSSASRFSCGTFMGSILPLHNCVWG